MSVTVKISVVIATYNRKDALLRTLNSIFTQNFSANDFEVVVVVDGSTDGTAEMLHKLTPPCAFRIIETANSGQAAARNTGWQAALGEIVLFLDDDMLCNPSLLSQHYAAHQKSASVVVFGPIPIAPESPQSLIKDVFKDYTDDLLRRLATQGAPKLRDETMVCSNASIRRTILAASGGFDERFFRHFEDVELGVRLTESGIRFQFEPTAVALHLYVKSAHSAVENSVWSGRSQVLLCRTHPGYRQHSMLRAFGRDSLFKRFVAGILIRSPVSLASLLRPLYEITDRLRWIPVFRNAGIRLHEMRSGIQFFRGAVREAGSLEIFNREFGMRLPILLYHYVGPSPSSSHFSISAEQFEKHVHWLSRHGYTGIAPSDWLRWCEQGAELPRKPVLLTFDDAFSDLENYALPVLRRYGFKAGVFAVTKRVGEGNTWDQTDPTKQHRLMDEEQIRYWSTQGIEFGAHSRTHPDLTSLTGAVLAEEIIGSRNDLESIMGSSVRSFAYPYGLQNEAVCACVQEAFKMAFTVEEGLNGLETDPFLLRRTSPTGRESLLELGFRVRYGWNLLQPLRSLVASLRSHLIDYLSRKPWYPAKSSNNGSLSPSQDFSSKNNLALFKSNNLHRRGSRRMRSYSNGTPRK